MYTFSGRDLVNLYHQKRLENGTHVAVAQSIETSEVPAVSGVVRATAMLIGSLFGKPPLWDRTFWQRSPTSDRPESLCHHSNQSHWPQSEFSAICQQLYHIQSDALIRQETTRRNPELGDKEIKDKLVTIIVLLFIYFYEYTKLIYELLFTIMKERCRSTGKEIASRESAISS